MQRYVQISKILTATNKTPVKVATAVAGEGFKAWAGDKSGGEFAVAGSLAGTGAVGKVATHVLKKYNKITDGFVPDPNVAALLQNAPGTGATPPNKVALYTEGAGAVPNFMLNWGADAASKLAAPSVATGASSTVAPPKK